jgi:periplasmic protein TonB
MFRHSSSFIISLLFHSLLLIVIFYSYKTLSSSSQEEMQEKRVCVALSCLPHKIDEPHKPTPSQPKEIKAEKKKPQKKVSQKQKKIEKPKKVVSPVVEDLVVVQESEEKPEKREEEVVTEESEAEHETKEVEKLVPDYEAIKEEQTKELKKDSNQKNPEVSSQEAYMNEHLQEIVRLLQENLYYPRSARKRGIEGQVVVKFKLSRNAEVISVEILSSEHSILSRGAIKTIESLSQKFPEPKEDIVLSIPINYSLRR